MDFGQIALLVVTAAIFGTIASYLKQPLLIGYLIAGFVLSIFGVFSEIDQLAGLAKIGVTLLLFLLGLEMNVREIASVGKPALITAFGQIIFTSLAGFFLVTILGYDLLPAIYIAVALTFSSTIIIVKLLSEKRDLRSLYGRIAIGVLLIQDATAIVILMLLVGITTGDASVSMFLWLLIKIVVLVGTMLFLSRKVLPKFFEKVARRSSELLFILSIAWALGVAALVGGPLGFSLEVGGFIAGLALSHLSEHLQIATRARPLRDFFLTVFFLTLGAELFVGGTIWPLVPKALLLSLFVLVGNPLIVILIMSFLGYRNRTSFLTGVTFGQISEFSLVLMTMGLGAGHVSRENLALVILIGIVTMTLSTYLVTGAEDIYTRIAKYLAFLERKKTFESAFVREQKLTDHIVLVGCDRTGRGLVRFLQRKKYPFVVVDFNPVVFNRLATEKVPVVLGDISDAEIGDAVSISEARVVVSTTANLTDNLTLLERLKKNRNQIVFVATVTTKEEALALYSAGATYVIVPEVLTGEYIRHLFSSHGVSFKRISKMGKSHFNRLLLAA